MTTLRRRFKSGFTTVPNTLSHDNRISLLARGLLVYLLAKPDGWKVRSTQISAESKEGRDKIRRALRELGHHGYYLLATERDGRELTQLTHVSDTAVAEWRHEALVMDPTYDRLLRACESCRAEGITVGVVPDTVMEDGLSGPEDSGADLSGPEDPGVIDNTVSKDCEVKNPPIPPEGGTAERGCNQHKRRRQGCPACDTGVPFIGFGERPTVKVCPLSCEDGWLPDDETALTVPCAICRPNLAIAFEGRTEGDRCPDCLDGWLLRADGTQHDPVIPCPTCKPKFAEVLRLREERVSERRAYEARRLGEREDETA